MRKIIMAFVLGCALYGCGAPVSKNTKDAAQLSKDSISLLAILNQDINVGGNVLKPVPTKITEFNNDACDLLVMFSEDREGAGAESVGTNKCTEAVKWLNENGYDLGMSGMFVSCSVHSPHTGTTGRKDMVTGWGYAIYDFNSDMVTWKPAK